MKVNHHCKLSLFSASYDSIDTCILMQALKWHQANTHAHRLWRKPSPCEPTSLPMSRTDLGQSWLMCPQLPRGFWSGGSSACSLTMNTDAELNITPILEMKRCHQNNIKTMISSKFAYTKVTIKTVYCLCFSCCVSTEWSGCIGLIAVCECVSQRWATQGYLNINIKQPTPHKRDIMWILNGQPAVELPVWSGS